MKKISIEEKKERSIEEKKEFLNHFFLYEIDMLESMNKSHENLFHAPVDRQFVENIIVETYLLHGRNLLEFFYYDDQQQDKATANEFLEKWNDWKKLRPPLTESLKILRRRVDRETTHLTYKRIVGKPESKFWNFHVLYVDLMMVFCIFAKNVAEEYADEKFRQFKERIC